MVDGFMSQNHEDSKRRWAHGSFLDAVHARVGGAWPRSWQVWLSCNAESDGTAIWLQTKFDVESNSGAWASENVYAIPAAEKGEALDPGVVVFECTPLVGDELERYVFGSVMRSRTGAEIFGGQQISNIGGLHEAEGSDRAFTSRAAVFGDGRARRMGRRGENASSNGYYRHGEFTVNVSSEVSAELFLSARQIQERADHCEPCVFLRHCCYARHG